MNKLLYALPFLLVLIFAGCSRKETVVEDDGLESRTLQEIRQSGELRILTLYSSTSYFIYKGEEMGYEFELARSFALSEGLRLTVVVANNLQEMKEMLQRGEGDLIAYPINYVLNPEEEKVIYCGNENISSQVLIQKQDKERKIMRDVTELIGKDIYVEENSKYQLRIRNLNDELGGGINIHTIHKDSLTTEDLIGMVANGTIPYTLADDNLARVNRTYYKQIDIKLQVSFPQRSSWIVNADADSLATAINKWFSNEKTTREYASISKRYFEQSKMPDIPMDFLLTEKGKLSHYDEIYKKYASAIKWDWRLLAALSYEESRFNPEVVSWAGARGLMQLMPITGKNFGLTDENFAEPEANIEAASKYIAYLQNSFQRIADPVERSKFVLGSFHAGMGHVFDAIALARKYGYNPEIWDNNVAVCLQLKSNPHYYNDDVVKCGYFPGNTTIEHVRDIHDRYKVFQQKVR